MRLLPLVLFIHITALSQLRSVQTYDLDVGSFRGIQMTDDSTVFLAGPKGMVLKVNLAGTGIEVDTMLAQGEHELRDIHVNDDGTILILAVHKPAYVALYSPAQGEWTTVLEDTTAFWDGFAFKGRKGMLYGDPVDGVVELYQTEDAGSTWQRSPQRIEVPEGVGGYAASGTGLVIHKDKTLLTLGGAEHSIYSLGRQKAKRTALEMRQGPAGGAYSMDVAADGHMIAVGGSYLEPDSTSGNCALVSPDGKVSTPVSPPLGYLSCVQWIADQTWVATGKLGTFISQDHGKNWHMASNHKGVAIAHNGDRIVLTERSGRLILFEVQ